VLQLSVQARHSALTRRHIHAFSPFCSHLDRAVADVRRHHCPGARPLPDKTDDKFQQECLKAMNNDRAKHHAPPLKLSQEAITYAKSRAQLISRFEGLSHGHEGLEGYGENLYWGGNSQNVAGNCQSAIDSWYREVGQYNYSKPGFSIATGHFTQLVWKGSNEVGCARAFGKGSKWYETYVVCNYKPVGNVQGQFPQNVLAP
jgi:glioma pathogenesis-related protein 2